MGIFSLNLLLMVFNLLPVPPLDGSGAVVLLLPEHMVPKYQNALWSHPQLGLLGIFEKDTFAVLELRGGTHLILQKSRKRTKPGAQAPVDFMVDDIREARAKYAKMAKHE